MLSWLTRRPRFKPLEPWQRDQYVVVSTVALAHIAFDLTQPFIPLYVRELGVTDLADAAFWSGLIVGTGPLGSGLMGPIWGAMADKYGRKPMVLRAMIMIGMMQAAMAFAPNVQVLLALRVVMGLFAGFTPMVMALAISVSPREKMSQAIGMVQAATFLPLAIGPTIGGAISDAFGLRFNFILTAILLLIPSAFLYFMVKETGYGSSASKKSTEDGPRGSRLALLAMPGFAAGVAIMFLARFTDRALPPILPLYLIELNTPTAQIATITGFVVACGAIAAACSSMLYGRWARPERSRMLLLIALGGGAVFSAIMAMVQNWPQVVVVRIILGLLAGGTMSLAFTMGARLVPPSRSGFMLSMLSSGGQFGGAVSPIMVGLVSQISLTTALFANAGGYLIAFALAALPGTGRVAAPAPEPVASKSDMAPGSAGTQPEDDESAIRGRASGTH